MRPLTVAAIYLILSTTMCAQDIIDVHSHIITPEFLSSLSDEGRLGEEGFPIPRYDVTAHLRWMDQTGVSTSILTMAAPHPLSAEAVRKANQAAAHIKKQHPGRFMFCATLPLPDIDAAIREAQYALDTLHADGIKLATNAQGQYLGAPELDTLFAILDKRQAIVILHPHRPQPVNSSVMAQTPLAMQEYLSETTRAVTNMISRNVPARYPDVRIVVPHCGAYLPLAVPRMQSLTPVMQANKLVGEIDWTANLRSLYYDLAGAHSPQTIRMLLTITTPDHLLYGSDYPYAAPQVLAQSLSRMQEYLSTEPDLAKYRDMILWKNARKLMCMHTADSSTAQGTSTTHTHKSGRESEEYVCRIAEIKVRPRYLAEYLTDANDVDRLSMEREPGVICLFPMQSRQDSTVIRILEIYASDEAYRQHIKTDHFLRYKQNTLHMVKKLRLPPLRPLDPETMRQIFKKHR